jgi:hypothetical protein
MCTTLPALLVYVPKPSKTRENTTIASKQGKTQLLLPYNCGYITLERNCCEPTAPYWMWLIIIIIITQWITHVRG